MTSHHVGDEAPEGADGPQPTVPARPAHHRRHHETHLTGFLHRLAAAAREVAVVAVMAIALSFVIKTWLFQAFYIPSGSMENTLLIGDRVIVNKLAPDVADLKRGDIIVFQDPGSWLPPAQGVDRGPLLNALEETLVFVGLLPDTAEDHLIKRVIGLPGDHVVCCDAQGRISVNGTALDEPYLFPGNPPSAVPFDVTVPAGRLWVMGDHRNNSDDSRFNDASGDGTTGSVPVDDVTGRAVAIVWPFSRWSGVGTPTQTFGGVPQP